eukprot:gene9950-biopygen3258
MTCWRGAPALHDSTCPAYRCGREGQGDAARAAGAAESELQQRDCGIRDRQEHVQGEQDTGADMARAWAVSHCFFVWGGAGVARA